MTASLNANSLHSVMNSKPLTWVQSRFCVKREFEILLSLEVVSTTSLYAREEVSETVSAFSLTSVKKQSLDYETCLKGKSESRAMRPEAPPAPAFFVL